MFGRFARPYRVQLVVLGILMIAAPIAAGTTVWIFRHLVDDVISVGRRDLFWRYAAFFSLASIASSFIGFCDDVLTTWVRQHFTRDTRAMVLQHVLHLPPHHFDTNPVGDILARLSSDVSAVESVFISASRDALSAIARVVVFGAFIVALDWRLALAALTVIPPFVFVARRFSTAMREVGRERRRRSGSVGAVAEEIVSGVVVVQAHNAQQREARRFDVEARAMIRAELRASRLSATYRPVVDTLELAGGLAVVWLGTVLIGRNELTVGAMLAFLAYVTQLYGPVRGLSKLGASLQHHLAGVDRVIELLDVPRDRAAAGRAAHRRHSLDAISFVPLQGTVAVRDVTFTYPSGSSEALAGIDLDLEAGRSVALVGPSGSGKSTIARLLLGWYVPTSGSISVDGLDTRLLDPASLREAISYLPQEPVLFDGTVAENIAYGRPDAPQEAIETAARAADAHEFVTALPDGYDTRVGSKGRLLSGGQRQRVALARAFLRDSPLLVLDEPLTALDPLSAERVVTPLQRLMAGRTTLVISHHLELAEQVDEIVVLDGGRIVERGSHHQLATAGGLYQRMLREREDGVATGTPTVCTCAADRDAAFTDRAIEPPGAGADAWVASALQVAMHRLAERTWEDPR